eukprot:3460812-Prymnesium_polylepis.1
MNASPGPAPSTSEAISALCSTSSSRRPACSRGTRMWVPSRAGRAAAGYEARRASRTAVSRTTYHDRPASPTIGCQPERYRHEHARHVHRSRHVARKHHILIPARGCRRIRFTSASPHMTQPNAHASCMAREDAMHRETAPCNGCVADSFSTQGGQVSLCIRKVFVERATKLVLPESKSHTETHP